MEDQVSEISFFKKPIPGWKDEVLSPRCNVNLKTDGLELHKSNMLADCLRHVPLPPLHGLPPGPTTKVPFDVSELRKIDFLNLLATCRNASATGLNKIPYKVYKKCPKIASYLFKLFKSCKKHNVITIYWRIAGVGKQDNPDPSGKLLYLLCHGPG